MKKIIFVILIPLFAINTHIFAQCGDELVDICVSKLGTSCTYLKEFKIKLKKAKKNEPAPVARFAVVLNKGTHYRFSVCNAEEFEGKAVIQLYDTSRLLGSSYNMATGKLYDGFVFVCKKTSAYHLFFSFKEGKEGCAVGILSMVKK